MKRDEIRLMRWNNEMICDGIEEMRLMSGCEIDKMKGDEMKLMK